MGNLADIEKLQSSLKKVEDRLDKIRSGLFGVEKDIDLLSTKASQLERNIQYLKKNKIIALASEYKKVRHELNSVKQRLEVLRQDRENFRTVYVHVELEIIKLKEELKQLYNKPDAVVIEANFRRQNGR